ncbi:uncharacterized protein TRUGW13939_06499 [Talaromyces rugulosus]|uniref:Uncharacterized protein n=1 Tax=Talaromyces rugulosus TaxID=121627 RepID=A0A7H8R0T5_TALRU|nr:uncharacterized protein TRUGW13939_06499 [Talaromyces rugulosus]QKX59365.1 hypothetical protein TRUGW13939_06499 [Talaromyces rugulosus]
MPRYPFEEEFIDSTWSQPSKAGVLEFHAANGQRPLFRPFQTIHDFDEYITHEDKYQDRGLPCRHRLYLLEDLNQEYKHWAKLHFKMNPTFFTNHSRVMCLSRVSIWQMVGGIASYYSTHRSNLSSIRTEKKILPYSHTYCGISPLTQDLVVVPCDSLFESIKTQWENAEQSLIEAAISDRLVSAVFLNRVVAAHWLNLTKLMLRRISRSRLEDRRLSWVDSKPGNYDSWKKQLFNVRGNLQDMSVFQERLMWWENEILLNLKRVGFAESDIGTDSAAAQTSGEYAKKENGHADIDVLQATRRDLLTVLCRIRRYQSNTESSINRWQSGQLA